MGRADLSVEGGAGEFGGPGGAALVESAFHADEGGRCSLFDPDADIAGLFADEGGDDAGYSTKLDVNEEAECFVMEGADADGIGLGWRDVEMDEARFGDSGEVADFGVRGRGAEIFEDGENLAVGEVVGELEGFGSSSRAVTQGDVAGGDIDGEVDGMGKGGTALDVVVEEDAEGSVLGEDGAFVVDGAVEEAVDKAGTDVVAVDGLNDFSGGESFAVF